MTKQAINSTSQWSSSLEELLGTNTTQKIMHALDQASNRRLSQTPETTVLPSSLCQMVHIAPHASERVATLGGETDKYYTHTTDSALTEIDSLLELGVNKIYLQLSANQATNPQQRIDAFASSISLLKSKYGNELSIIADPQGLCMNPNLRWGILGADGAIDAVKTLELVAVSATSFAEAGTDAYMTIGRINCEAKVARAALDRAGHGTKLYAFSTNSETPNAYFALTATDVTKAQTGQKILVGNSAEMTLRAVLDIQEGVDVVLQKPMENFHMIGVIQSLIDGTTRIEDFSKNPKIQSMTSTNAALFSDGLISLPKDQERLRQAKVGAYEVSGSYAIYKMIEDRYSRNLAWAMTNESFLNAINATGGKIDVLVGRNMKWYAAIHKEFNGNQSAISATPVRNTGTDRTQPKPGSGLDATPK